MLLETHAFQFLPGRSFEPPLVELVASLFDKLPCLGVGIVARFDRLEESLVACVVLKAKIQPGELIPGKIILVVGDRSTVHPFEVGPIGCPGVVAFGVGG